MQNIPQVKLGIVAVSRDCFPIELSQKRRGAILTACAAKGLDVYEAKTTVENEKDMLAAVEEVKAAGCNALTVFLGNFGPETPETLIAKYFDGPCMYVAAAEGDGDLINGRGDAYCGMLNCSYNLGMRHLKGYIPEYPIGTAEEIAEKMAEFVPISRAILGIKGLKIITFGPRPQDFFACNAPIKGLYELGVEVEENSELDLLVSYKEHANDPRIDEVCADMAAEMGEGKYYPDLLARMAQFELTLLDWAEGHKGSRQYVAFADKCWPAFPSQFGFEPCYVNSRLASRGIPVSCEVDIYGALSEYIGMCLSGDTVTLLDINNSVPQYLYDEDIKGKFPYALTDTFMGFHCGNTPSCKMCADRAVKYQLIQHRLLEPAGSDPGLHTRHAGRGHRGVGDHLLPPAVRQRRRTAQLHCGRRGPAGGDPELRRHRCVRHPGDGPLLPPCAGAEALPAPRRGGLRPLRQADVRAVQISRHHRHRLQPAQNPALPDREPLGLTPERLCREIARSAMRQQAERRASLFHCCRPPLRRPMQGRRAVSHVQNRLCREIARSAMRQQAERRAKFCRRPAADIESE